MSKEKTNELVPKLRFPEFQNSGEWVPHVLGENHVSQFVEERISISKLLLRQYISTENLLSDFGGVIAASNLPPSGSFTAFKKGDILISNIRPYLKKVWVANFDGAASNDIIVVRALNLVSESFLPHVLKNDRFIDFIMVGAKGVKMPRGDKSLMKDYPVLLPKQNEQQKIADCLSSLDELVSAETQKLEALKTYKKGLLQNLFSAEGDTVPRLRFPEFQETGEWEERPLANVCRMQAGKFVRANEISETLSKDRYPCYGGNGLRGYTNSFTHYGKYSLIGRQGALCGNITLADGHFHATEHAVVAIPEEGIDTDWLYYLLIKLDLNRFATGQAQPGLSIENLEKVETKVPRSKVEQKAIAEILSSIDELINNLFEKIEGMKSHKKALMQQLFPNPSTMTE